MTLAQQAARQVRAWLHDGTLDREQFHSVPQIAGRLGMSRSPVREGLLGLADAGLIEFVPQRGFRAVRPSGRDIAEIFALRLALEPAAARRAAAAPQAGLAPLRAATERMRVAADRDDAQGFARADEALHEQILTLAGNRRLVALVAGLRDTTRLIGASTAGRTRSAAAIVRDHEPIVTALLAGDGAASEAAMRRHLEHTGRLLVDQASADGDSLAWRSWTDLIEDDARASRG